MLYCFCFQVLDLNSFGVCRITLADGKVKEGKRWLSSPLDIAREISKSLAANALIAQVDGTLWDMNRPLESDCELKIFTFDSDEGRDTFWHSSAHILGQVSLSFVINCQLSIKFELEHAQSKLHEMLSSIKLVEIEAILVGCRNANI